MFKRILKPKIEFHGENLTAAAVGIGMNFAMDPIKNPPIEDVLFFCTEEAMVGDLRMMSILVAWIEIHYHWINVNRLKRIIATSKSENAKKFWCAVGQWLHVDPRFKTLIYTKRRFDILGAGTDFHIGRHGEDPRFKNSCMRVPANVLRKRDGDVFTSQQLAKIHAIYRHRVQQGPSYRADMWATLEMNPSMTAAELARSCYGSFETARNIKRDFMILEPTLSR